MPESLLFTSKEPEKLPNKLSNRPKSCLAFNKTVLAYSPIFFNNNFQSNWNMLNKFYLLGVILFKSNDFSMYNESSSCFCFKWKSKSCLFELELLSIVMLTSALYTSKLRSSKSWSLTIYLLVMLAEKENVDGCKEVVVFDLTKLTFLVCLDKVASGIFNDLMGLKYDSGLNESLSSSGVDAFYKTN